MGERVRGRVMVDRCPQKYNHAVIAWGLNLDW